MPEAIDTVFSFSPRERASHKATLQSERILIPQELASSSVQASRVSVRKRPAIKNNRFPSGARAEVISYPGHDRGISNSFLVWLGATALSIVGAFLSFLEYAGQQLW